MKGKAEMVLSKGISRRSFLRGVSATSLLAGGGGCASVISSRSPNSLLCHACIGTANMAEYDMEQFLANPRVKVVALCDVDATFLAAAKKKAPGARIYRDWRELLAAEGDRLDSLNVITFDMSNSEIKRNTKLCEEIEYTKNRIKELEEELKAQQN